jgi:aflatoxin B1 aldehyde reductase
MLHGLLLTSSGSRINPSVFGGVLSGRLPPVVRALGIKRSEECVVVFLGGFTAETPYRSILFRPGSRSTIQIIDMVKIIAGLMGSSVASGSTKLSGPEQLRSFLTGLKKHNIKELDTARVYNSGKSEQDLGALPEAHHDFSIATKAPGFSPGSLAFQKVLDNCNASLAALKQSKLDLYYFHGPDRATPLEESLRAINQLYQEDKFARFGVSNYHATEVQAILDICDKQDFIKPSVYQGGYNALARAGEKELFPLLRKHNIAFYAYSPLAGGYFSRPATELRAPPEGSRMNQMQVFSAMYVNDLSLEIHDALGKACEAEGLTLKEATLRWLMHHSILGEEDGVILGASSLGQMEENLRACEGGPLSGEIVGEFERAWERFSGAGYSKFYSIPLP